MKNPINKFVKCLLTKSQNNVTISLIQKRPPEKRRYQRQPPPAVLVAIVRLLIYLTFVLTGLQVFHMIFLHSWNNEIWNGVVAIISIIGGILIGKHVES